jgi:hypothetical protein
MRLSMRMIYPDKKLGFLHMVGIIVLLIGIIILIGIGFYSFYAKSPPKIIPLQQPVFFPS